MRSVAVVVSDEFKGWYEDLSLGEQESVFAIEGSCHGLRELRIQHQGRPYRVLYAFDPGKRAVLLLGGDKTGRDRFYEEYIPRAEAIWERYLAEREANG